MKKSEIVQGGHYIARVSGKLTTVRVDAIRETQSYRAHHPHTPTTMYDVTNLATGRKTTFRSAQKFRRAVTETLRKVKTEPESDLRKKEKPERWPQFVAYMESIGNVLDEFTDKQLRERFEQWEDEQRPDPQMTSPTALCGATFSPLSALLARSIGVISATTE